MYGKWLFVFENVEEWSIIQNFWPFSSNTAVIITIQNPDLAQFTKSEIHLKPLSVESSTELLFSHLRRMIVSIMDSEKKAANNIFEKLFGLLTAVAHIASYIDQSQSSLDGVLKGLLHETALIRDVEPSSFGRNSILNARHTRHSLGYGHQLFNAPSYDLSRFALLSKPRLHPRRFLAAVTSEDFNHLIADLRRRHLVGSTSKDSVSSLSIYLYPM
jgi:hypothetical protein